MKRDDQIQSIFKAMPRVKGFVRTVNECEDCHELFGRTFIPHGIGRGLTTNTCLCQLTAHRPFKVVAERRP